MMLDVNEDVGNRAAADIPDARFFCTDISDKGAVDSTSKYLYSICFTQ